MGLDGESIEFDDDFVRIAEREGAPFMEFPKEENKSILLSTIQAQYPHAIGLKYKGSTGAWRAIREANNVLDAPKGGWGDSIYYLSSAETNKHGVSSSECKPPKMAAPTNQLLQDLAVIGLPYRTTEEELRNYFESNYGELSFCEVKLERETGKSRGFGFIRFKDEVCAKKAVDGCNGYHFIEGRRVEVRMKKDKPMKLFVGRVPHGTTVEELNSHFSQFGYLTDTYIPSPFRNYAFITFASSEDAKCCMKESHILNGNRLNVIERNERNPEEKKAPKTAVQGGYDNETLSMFRNGLGNVQGSFLDFASQNGVDGQPKSNNNIDTDLKSLLYQFLANQKI